MIWPDLFVTLIFFESFILLMIQAEQAVSTLLCVTMPWNGVKSDHCGWRKSRNPTFTISTPRVKIGVISLASIFSFSNASCRVCPFFFYFRALEHNLQQINDKYVELPPHQQIAVQKNLQELLYRPSNLPQGPRRRPAGSANRRTNDTASTRREPSGFELFHSGSGGRRCWLCQQSGQRQPYVPKRKDIIWIKCIYPLRKIAHAKSLQFWRGGSI